MTLQSQLQQPFNFDLKEPQTYNEQHFYKLELMTFAIGLTSSSLLLINFNTIRFADFGPNLEV